MKPKWMALNKLKMRRRMRKALESITKSSRSLLSS
jgi:hypothetical protein